MDRRQKWYGCDRCRYGRSGVGWFGVAVVVGVVVGARDFGGVVMVWWWWWSGWGSWEGGVGRGRVVIEADMRGQGWVGLGWRWWWGWWCGLLTLVVW